MISVAFRLASRTCGSFPFHLVPFRQSPHLRIARSSVQDGVCVDEWFISSRINTSPRLVPSRKVHTANVEAMYVGRQYPTNEEDAIDQAICAELVEKSHGKRWEEDVKQSDADSITECAKHYYCSLVLMVVWYGLRTGLRVRTKAFTESR